ncbi:MAG TPA: response regulator transcription factor [Thermoleophilaceae bacterium]|nr:response regulator transcription factor [Thermoleophilaceae bacterium]
MPAAAVSALRLLVVDDHPVVRQGIRALLERELDGVEVATADTPDAALREAASPGPDVVVIDLRRVSGDVQTTINSLQQKLGSPIVVFTADGGPRMLAEALKAGVKGYVRKDSPPEDLIRAIQAARSGEFYVDPALSSSLLLEEGERTLTARQREILQMLADGMHTEEVANRLGLSTETVRTHTKRILAKLQAGTRTQAVAIGIRSGLIE